MGWVSHEQGMNELAQWGKKQNNKRTAEHKFANPHDPGMDS